jgi:hypothetical protein
MVYDPHPLKEGDRVEVLLRAHPEAKATPAWATVVGVRPQVVGVRPQSDFAWAYKVRYDEPMYGYEGEGFVADLNLRPLTILELLADAAKGET